MTFKILQAIIKFLDKLFVSNLDFDTSRGVEVSAGEGPSAGITVQGVRVKDLGDEEKTQWFDFVGGGVGFSIGTGVGVSISTADMPSAGTRILKNPFRVVFGLDFDDLEGIGSVFTFSAAYLGGKGYSLILFNEFLDPIGFKAAVFTEGIFMGTPGTGIMLYKGVWRKVDE